MPTLMFYFTSQQRFKRLMPLGAAFLLLAASLFSELNGVQAGLTFPTQVLTSSYFGGSGNENITGVAPTPDGGFIIVGSSTAPTFRAGKAFGTGSTCSSSNAGGFIAKLGGYGRGVQWYSYFNCGVAVPYRVAVDSTGAIYVAGIAKTGFAVLLGGNGAYPNPNGGDDPFVAKISADGLTLLWGSYHPGGSDLDDVHIGLVSDNQPVISGRSSSAGNRIFLARFSANGQSRTSYGEISDPLAGGAFVHINGLAVRADGLVAPVGYYQRETNLKVPFLIAYDSTSPNMGELWRNYASPVPTSLRADTTGLAVNFTPNGDLIAAFTPDGGNTIIERDPKNSSSGKIPQLSGAYQNSHGRANGAAPSSFIGRYAAASGSILDATFFHSTLSDGRTNTTKVQTVGVDAANRVYLAGVTACCLPFTGDAFRQTYAGGEGFFVIMDANMSRLDYATYMGSGAGEEFRAMAINGGKIVLGGETSGTNLTTSVPLQPSTGGLKDGMLAAFTPPADVVLETVAQPGTTGAGQASGAITVRLRDTILNVPATLINPVNLTVSSSNPNATFSTTQGGAFSPTLNLSIGAGLPQASFYFKSSQFGQIPVTVNGGSAGSLGFSLNVVQLTVAPGQLNFRANRLGAPPSASQSADVRFNGNATTGWQLNNVSYGAGATGWLDVINNSAASTPSKIEVKPNQVLAVGTYNATVNLRDPTYNTTASFTVAYTVAEVKLALIGDRQTVGTNFESGAIGVEVQDVATGTPVKLATNALTINAGTSSQTGSFSTTPGGAVVTSGSIGVGSSRVLFYYKDSAAGTPNLSFSASGFAPVAQLITIVDPASCSNLPPTVVNHGGDQSSADPCRVTLREALNAVASLPPAEREITFSPSVTTVLLTSGLGQLPDELRITGRCTAANKPGVRLDGSATTGSTIGLDVSTTVTVSGVAVYGFSGTGLSIGSGETANVECFYLGTPDGTARVPNGGGVKVLAGGRLNLLDKLSVVLRG
jgi:hypothetical protein